MSAFKSDTPALIGQVCGTCANGTPTEVPHLIECRLPWEVHDRQDKGYNAKTGKADVPVHLGHGDLLMPVASATHRCLIDAWRPYP